MIIDKSLLNPSTNLSESSALGFDMINYASEIMNESMSNTKLLLVQEGFLSISDAKFNFSLENIFTSIVNGIVKALKMLLGKIVEILLKLASMGKSFELEIRAFKDKIKHYKGSVTMEDSYKYTYIYGENYDKYPSTSLVELLVEDINDMIIKMKEAFDSNTKSAKQIQYNALAIKPNIEYCHRVFRHKLLGNTNNNFGDHISDEIFIKECFKKFHNGKDTPSTITINAEDLYETIYIPYIEQRKNIDRIKRDNTRIQSNVKRSLESVKDLKFDFSRFTDAEQQTLLQTLNDMQKDLCTLYELKCKDVVTMYTTKLQAYKDFVVSAKPWLVKTIQQIGYQGVVG